MSGAATDYVAENLVVERNVLGVLLECPTQVARAEAQISRNVFARDLHARAFDVLVARANRGELTSLELLKQELRDHGGLIPDEAVELNHIDAGVGPAMLDQHCGLLRMLHARRQAIAANHDLGHELRNGATLAQLSDRARRLQEHVDAIGAGGATPEPWPALDLDGELKPVPMILPGLMPERAIVLNVGETGHGKSTIKAAQSHAITARVKPWIGGEAPATARPVVYFDAEMGPVMTQRLFRRVRDGLGLDATPEMLTVYSDPGGISLVTPEGRQRIEAAFKAAADRHGLAPVLMIDTLSAVLAGLESFNDAARIEPIYAHLFRWRDREGLTIQMGHHPRKRAKGEGTRPTLDQVRDSTTHVGKCSDVLFCRKPTHDAMFLDVFTLKCRGRDAVPTLRIGYQSDGGDRPIVLSLLAAPRPADDPLVLRAEQLVAAFLRENGVSKRATILEHLESLDVTESTGKRALESLVDLGAVSRPKRGYYSAHAVSQAETEEE